jgi:carbonic anhydrase
MEQEKIDLARKQLEEDKEKFEKMMNDSEKNVKRTIDEVKQAGIVKSKLMKQIEDLNIKINGKEGNIKRVEEELV